MKTTLIYLHVVKSGYPTAPPPEYYLPFSQRWVNTYRQFDAGMSHELVIGCCGGEPSKEIRYLYHGLFCQYKVYTGAGSDIGACQAIMRELDTDFVVCMSTPVYFWHPGWLARIVVTRKFFGDGLYGPMASYQNRPHIRTSCWGVDPKTFAQYPFTIDCREKACWAESFGGIAQTGQNWQISDWYLAQGKPALLVTWKEVVDRAHWRTPDNIFRRGDQSNCIVWDQHVDFYHASHYHDRIKLAKMADEDTTALPENTQEA